MRCDRCGEDKPLEHFEVGLMRAPLYSDEMQALDRLRKEPQQLCRTCFRPASAVEQHLDRQLSDTSDTNTDLDMLADVVDWVLRKLGRR